MSFHPVAREAFNLIGFGDRFKALAEKYTHEPTMDKVEKNEILSLLKALNYSFTYAEKTYVYKEVINDQLNFHVVLAVKYGIVVTYFTVEVDNNYIDLDSGNLGFVYKSIEGTEYPIANPGFRSYDEFKEIATAIMSIYEDFKKAFIKLTKV
jgi:hypothetical protein